MPFIFISNVIIALYRSPINNQIVIAYINSDLFKIIPVNSFSLLVSRREVLTLACNEGSAVFLGFGNLMETSGNVSFSKIVNMSK